MYVEIEKWDSGSEEAWLWVSNAGWTVSSTEDTTLYLYYDSSQADNTTYVGETGSAPGQAPEETRKARKPLTSPVAGLLMLKSSGQSKGSITYLPVDLTLPGSDTLSEKYIKN